MRPTSALLTLTFLLPGVALCAPIAELERAAGGPLTPAPAPTDADTAAAWEPWAPNFTLQQSTQGRAAARTILSSHMTPLDSSAGSTSAVASTPAPRNADATSATDSASADAEPLVKLTPGSAAAAKAVGYDYAGVLSQGARLASHSWEYGAVSEALLEVYNPELSVFGPSSTAFPGGKLPTASPSAVRALAYARPHIRTNATTLVDGDGAAGDPASLGVAAFMIGQSSPAYLAAAQRQVSHLLNQVPRYSNGAISQRESVAALWADFMYMAPPTLAYAAVQAGDISAMKSTVAQCADYRAVLRVPTGPAAGLWQHIVGPQSQSLGVWSTGNAWAALGMVRVLATMKSWSRTSAWTSNPQQLRGYVYEILDGVLSASSSKGAIDPSSGLLRNYLVGGANGYADKSYAWFGEAAGTAGLAAAMYRMAVLDRANAARYLPWANAARKAVAKAVGKNDIVAPTVNPLDWYDRRPYTAGSPEGQAFVVMLGAAYVDCINAGVCA